MLELAARLIFPVSLIVALTFWVKAYSGLGDGFSAGAAAGVGAVVQYVCLTRRAAAEAVGARWAIPAIGLGLLVMVGTLFAPTLFGAMPVTHAPGSGGRATTFGALELHTSLLFDLGVAMVVYSSIVATFDRLFPIEPGGAP